MEYFIGRFFNGFFRPKAGHIGMEFAGEVESAGAAVEEFSAGDRVFGIGSGTNAEYVCVRAEGAIARIPDRMSFEDAAAVPDGGLSAISLLRTAGVERGQKVLVYGASGSIGTAAVQLAKHFGARVTAVTDTRHVELARSLGADEVIDYTKEDFRRNGVQYDVIHDAVGKLRFTRCKNSLKPGGAFLPTDGFGNFAMALWTRWFGDKKVRVKLPPRHLKEHVVLLKQLIEAGEYRAIIDRTYPLEDVVEATRYVETGQKTGNVVLIVDRGS